MGLYRHCLRPVLFRLDAEAVHGATLRLAGVVGATAAGRAVARRPFCASFPRLACRVAGIDFPSPLGLAAGFDKNGRALAGLAAIGFGAVEVGSVSAHASAGNPRPRLFRLPADEAIVVNYGVPNDGAAVVARRVAAARPLPVPVGVNLVETNTGRPADPDAVVGEFVDAARPFVGLADYLTLNLNCPNTTGGVSPFDDAGRLRELLGELARLDGIPPVFLKFTAHRDAARADALLLAADPHAYVAGFIFNLPPGTDYPVRTPAARLRPLPGTLCGPPVRALMDATLAFWYGRIDRRRHVLVGSGGITSAAEAYRKIRLGATLLQLYTALVYQGPGLPARLLRGLLEHLDRDGLTLADAVGADAATPGNTPHPARPR